MSEQDLPRAILGRTGLEVSRLGYGAMELAGLVRPVSSELAGRILGQVVDAGINFIDTSPDYGPSEERIGEHLRHRRDEFYLASKCGCQVPTPEPSSGLPGHVFTPENIRAGVEQSLRRMQTDHLDLVQFHMSPSRSELEENGAVEALQKLQSEGKVRFLGMSGVLPDLLDHIAMGVFDVFQIPYSGVDREHEAALEQAAAAGAGNVIRGGVARGAPAPDKDPENQRLEIFKERMRSSRDRWDEARLDELRGDQHRMEFLLRLTLSHPDVHTTIVGTTDPDHLASNLRAAAAGPLPDDVVAEVRARLGALD